VREVEYRTILVPVFDEKLDDEIVGTAGRLAIPAGRDAGAEGRPRLDLVYVIEVPLTLPLDANLGQEEMERANKAIGRAMDVAGEYQDLDVTSRVVRARSRGIGGQRPPEIGEVTEYVLKKAPCRVLLTAPAEVAQIAD
jgi:APA family basic amino acid/polyamine antiporter